jgi:two-component system, NtrC family, sensor kinase
MSLKGTLTLKTEASSTHLKISIQDTGEGIPQSELDKIFDPFFTTKEVGSGTGLGLSICHGIIQRHDGTMKVESQKGKGTTIVLELPLKVAEAKDSA